MRFMKVILITAILIELSFVLYIKLFPHKVPLDYLKAINLNTGVFYEAITSSEYNNKKIIKKMYRAVTLEGRHPKDMNVYHSALRFQKLFSQAIVTMNMGAVDGDSISNCEHKIRLAMDSLYSKEGNNRPNLRPYVNYDRNIINGYKESKRQEALDSILIVLNKHNFLSAEYAILMNLAGRVGFLCCFCFNKIGLIAIPKSNELIDGDDYEVDIYFGAKLWREIPFETILDYGEIVNLPEPSFIKFPVSLENEDPTMPIQKKWKATVDLIDTSIVVEGTYTVLAK